MWALVGRQGGRVGLGEGFQPARDGSRKIRQSIEEGHEVDREAVLLEFLGVFVGGREVPGIA